VRGIRRAWFILLSLLLLGIWFATPAHATVAACGPTYKVVNNSHGRLEVYACVRHVAGGYESAGHYACFHTGDYTPINCNLGIGHQQLWDSPPDRGPYLSDDISISELGLNTGTSSWLLFGRLEGCYPFDMFTQIYDFTVRFPDNTLWTNAGATVGSQFLQGTLSC